MLSQYPLVAVVERPGPGRRPLGPLSVFGLSLPGSNSVGLGQELSSMLEVESPAGDMSSMLEAEGACASAILRYS